MRCIALTLLAVSLCGVLHGCVWDLPRVRTAPPPTPRGIVPQPFIDEPDGVNRQPQDVSRWSPPQDTWTPKPDVAPMNRNPAQFPPLNAPLAIGNATAQELVLRVRVLDKNVQVDCEAIGAAPQLWLSRKLFAPAQVWLVPSGRTFGLSQRFGACSAFLVDGSGVPMSLVFWKNNEFPVVQMPSTVIGALPGRMLAVGGQGEGATFAKHAALFPPPPAQAANTPPGCAFGQAGDAVVWSEPVPVGDWTVVDVVSAPNGCHVLQLLGKTGISPWTICLPLGAMPFEAGDDFFGSPLKGGHNLGQIVGLDLLGAPGKRLRFGRGQDIVYFGKGDGKLAGQPTCGVGHDACGSALLPVAAAVTIDGKTTKLAAGQAVGAGIGKLMISRAFDSPVTNTSCDGAPLFGRWVESVYVEGGKP